MAFLACVALLLLALPAAALDVTAVPPADPLVPFAETPATLLVRMDCTELVQAPTPTMITIEHLTAPAGLVATGPATVPIDPTACANADAATTIAVPLHITADMSVLAEVPHTLQWEVALEGGPATPVGMAVNVSYTGGFDVTVPTTIKQAAPQKEIRFPVELRNLANGPTVITAEALGDLAGQVVVPPAVVLAAAGAEGDAATVLVLYATPFENGPNKADETFTVSFRGASPTSGDPAGEPVERTFLAKTRGMYIPGAAPLLLPLALLAGAAALRHRP